MQITFGGKLGVPRETVFSRVGYRLFSVVVKVIFLSIHSLMALLSLHTVALTAQPRTAESDPSVGWERNRDYVITGVVLLVANLAMAGGLAVYTGVISTREKYM